MAVNWVQNPFLGRQTPFYQPEEQYDTSGSSWMGGVGADTQTPPQVDSIFAPAQPGTAVAGGAALLGGDTGGTPPGAEQMDYPSAEAIERRRKLAEALMGKQMEVNHPMQAIANAVSQITGAYINYKADSDQKKYEQHRRDVYRQSFDAAGGDLDKLMAAWMKSGDPDLVDKAYDYQLKKMVASQQGADAPTVRRFFEGGSYVDKQWDPKSKGWVQIGDPAPRWKGAGGGGGGDMSGGDASFDNEGGVDPYALDDDTLTFMAQQYLAGDKSVMVNLGRGKVGVKNIIAMRKKIRELASQKDPNTGQPMYSPGRVAAADKDLQGYGASVRTSETAGAKQGQAAYEARNMAGDVIAFSRRVPRSNIRYLAWVENEFRAQTGDPDVVAFAAALNAYINTYGRAISPAGVPTVSDKEHARKILSTSMSQGQIEQGIAVLDREMQNAIAAPYQQRDARRGAQYGDGSKPEHAPPLDEDPRFGGKQVGPSGAPSRPAPPQPGQVIRGWRFKGGDPRDRNNYEKVQ